MIINAKIDGTISRCFVILLIISLDVDITVGVGLKKRFIVVK